MFLYISGIAGGNSNGGFGPGMGQGHPSWQFVSNGCLQFDIFTFLYLYILTFSIIWQ